MEADLQDVWSVRKNIQHNSQNQKHKSGTATVAAAQYSRHGAIPAQPTQGPQIPKGTESTEKGDVTPQYCMVYTPHVHKSLVGKAKRIPLQGENWLLTHATHVCHLHVLSLSFCIFFWCTGHNSDSQPWSVRATNFSYSEAAKRPIESPNNDLTSPPLAKRKNIPDIIRPTNHFELPPLVTSKGNVPFLIYTPSHHPPTSILLFLSLLSKMESSFSTFTDTSLHASVPSSDTQENKKNYAKKMAQAHQRSVGMGEFTPKRDSYHPDTSSKTTKWKRRDSDEFDFET